LEILKNRLPVSNGSNSDSAAVDINTRAGSDRANRLNPEEIAAAGLFDKPLGENSGRTDRKYRSASVFA
jgi:hypothetical protein